MIILALIIIIIIYIAIITIVVIVISNFTALIVMINGPKAQTADGVLIHELPHLGMQCVYVIVAAR